MSKAVYDVITDKRSIPFNVTGTGNVETFGQAIVGTGTIFLTEMIAGSYLVDVANWECRRVIRVDSDTVAFLEKPFTTDLTSNPPEIISKQTASPREISVRIIPGDPNGKIENKVFSGILNRSKASSDRTSMWDNIDPFVVDASGTSMRVDIIY